MSALISDCGQYRYALRRTGDLFDQAKSGLLFLMLNPSTADARVDDKTITRCRSFARAFGYGEFEVGNLYALRSTSPAQLWRSKDAIGPENDFYLRELAARAELIVCAWGEEAKIDRVVDVCDRLKAHQSKFRCLQVNQSGMPRHPLYVKGDRMLSPWSVERVSITEGIT